MTVSTLLLIGPSAGRDTLILCSIYVGRVCQQLTASGNIFTILARMSFRSSHI